MVIIERGIVRKLLHSMRAKGYNQKHVLIVGCSELTIRFLERINRNKQWGYNVVGLVDDGVYMPKMNEKDKEYKPDVNELVIKNNMLPETVIILQMIYRDFLCSEEEREILKKKEQEIANKKYEENMNKYSYENLFKKRKDDSFEVKDETIENKKMELIEIKPKWYEKIVEFFKSILKK